MSMFSQRCECTCQPLADNMRLPENLDAWLPHSSYDIVAVGVQECEFVHVRSIDVTITTMHTDHDCSEQPLQMLKMSGWSCWVVI